MDSLLFSYMYDKDILYVLMEAGSAGLPVKKIARHVHNAKNTLFYPVPFDDVYKYVQKYVQANVKGSDSILEKVGKGRYRINERGNDTQQLLLDFKDDKLQEQVIPLGNRKQIRLQFEE